MKKDKPQGFVSPEVAEDLAGLTYTLGPQMSSLTAQGIIPTPAEVAEYIRKNKGRDIPIGLRVALRDLTHALGYAIGHSALNHVLENGVDAQSIAAFRALIPLIKDFED